MNRYKVTLESQDKRTWEVIVKADGISDRCDIIVFWRWWGLFKNDAHYVSKDGLLSVIGEPENR